MGLEYKLHNQNIINRSDNNCKIYTNYNGQYIVGGIFTDYNGNSTNHIIKINTVDGTIDTSFVVGTGTNQIVDDLYLLNNNKILMGGGFGNYNGTNVDILVLLNNDGSLDTNFSNNLILSGSIRDIALQSDNSIIVVGSITRGMEKISSDGTKDSTFNSGGDGFSAASLRKVLIQSDDKIIAVGGFTSYNGTTANRIIRLNTDGTIDNTFNTGTGFTGTTWDIARQSDNKLIICGNFSSFNGTNKNSIVRLNTDGTLDTTFSVGTGFNNNAMSLAVQYDDKIIVGGIFTSYNGITSNRIIRLNSDGTRDSSFNIGTGFSGHNPLINNENFILEIVVQSDRKLLIGGAFTGYNGASCNRFVRLNNNGNIDGSINANFNGDLDQYNSSVVSTILIT